MKGEKRLEKKVKPQKAYFQQKRYTKKQAIIEYKIKYPRRTHAEIARRLETSTSYVSNVLSKYWRKMVTLKGSPLAPLPFSIQGFGYCVDGLHIWYLDCPIEPSNNRNRQKVYRCAFYTIVFHVKGSILIHPWHEDWKKELRNWLGTWMLPTEIDLFFDYVTPLDQKHICVPAPGVPTGYRFKVPGVGTLTTDRTPYHSGTLEYEFDPGFNNKLDGIIKAIEGNSELIEKQTQTMEIFAKGMTEHMKLIVSLQDVSKSMMDVLMEMKKNAS